MLAEAMRGDEGTYVEEQLLIMERNGYPVETYYTFSYSPIPNNDGEDGGIICATVDDICRVIGERQTRLLRDVTARSLDARTLADACERCATALATYPGDLPFALIYLADDGSGFRRAGTTRIESGHLAAPGLAPRDDTFWPLTEAIRTHEPQMVSDLGGRIAQALPSGSWAALSASGRRRPHSRQQRKGRHWRARKISRAGDHKAETGRLARP